MHQSSVWKVTAVFGQGHHARKEILHVVADDEDEAISWGVVVLSEQLSETEWQPPMVSAESVLSPVFLNA